MGMKQWLLDGLQRYSADVPFDTVTGDIVAAVNKLPKQQRAEAILDLDCLRFIIMDAHLKLDPVEESQR